MLSRLQEYLQGLSDGGIALAYSGGVDSTLLLAVLGQLRQKQHFALEALTMRTVLQDRQEMADAGNLAKKFGVPQKIFTFNPFSADAVRHNRTDRCYHCKKAIFAQFKDYCTANGLKYLLDGTNADDLKVYRPGRKALQELGVISPLAGLGITKDLVRSLSAELGLPTAGKPAVPCLATRFEYNTLLSEEMIRRVADGEKIIKEMFPALGDIRLRVHKTTARIEVSAENIPLLAAEAGHITAGLKALGFEYITLDLEGYRSGSFDTNLKGKEK